MKWIEKKWREEEEEDERKNALDCFAQVLNSLYKNKHFDTQTMDLFTLCEKDKKRIELYVCLHGYAASLARA